MKNNLRIAGLSLTAVTALTGCTLNGLSSPSTGAVPSAETSSANASCVMGYVNIPAGSGASLDEKTFTASAPIPDVADGYDLGSYTAMRLIVSASNGSVTVGDLTVIFYDQASNEISSATVPFDQTVADGQSMTVTYDESMGSQFNPPENAITCGVN